MEKRERVYTVSEITKDIRSLLSSKFQGIWVEGEISNFKLHSSGHMYFDLKDEKSIIKAAFFKGSNQYLRFIPENGMLVLVHGSIDVYEKSGQYQIIVDLMEPVGVGALQIRFEQLKEKLRQEGLFDESHKKKIPVFPQRIGIVTSPTGAAIRDILNIINRRFPNVHIIINPVRVQGDGAAEEVANAIDEMNKIGGFDVLIVGRGGGSSEDLWTFNEEVVARAIYNSRIPVVSAVGHEVDYTIADFVADLRAPTPSAAAELIVRSKDEWIEGFNNYEVRLKQELTERFKTFKEKINWIKKSGLVMGLRRTLEVYMERIQNIRKSRVFLKPKEQLIQLKQEVDEMEENFKKTFLHFMEIKKKNMQLLEGKIFSLNPLNILKRGYSVTLKKPEDIIVKDSSELKKDDEIEVKFHKGNITGKVISV